MLTTDSRWSEQDASSRWFRALDQRVIQVGLQEWRLHVTGIYVQADEIWIQLSDGGRYGGSVLLRVSLDTPVEQAVRLLARSSGREVSMYPTVVTAHVECPAPRANEHGATNSRCSESCNGVI